MNGDSINTQFKKVIQSLGYSELESANYTKSFDIPRKIQTIASAYLFSERKAKVLECLDELKSRNSLVNLLFLRYTIESMANLSDISSEEVWQLFIRHQGVDVMECGLGSTSSDFLNNLVEFIVFVQRERGICPRLLPSILKKYNLIDRVHLLSYINLRVDRSALLTKVHGTEPTGLPLLCYCSTFLKAVVDSAMALPVIKNELNFLASEEYEIRRLLTVESLQGCREKFTNKDVYNVLVSQAAQPGGAVAMAAPGASREPDGARASRCTPVSECQQGHGVVAFSDKADQKMSRRVEVERPSDKEALISALRAQQSEVVNALKKELEALKFENLTLKHKVASAEKAKLAVDSRVNSDVRGSISSDVRSSSISSDVKNSIINDVKSSSAINDAKSSPTVNSDLKSSPTVSSEPPKTSQGIKGLFNRLNSKPTSPIASPETQTQEVKLASDTAKVGNAVKQMSWFGLFNKAKSGEAAASPKSKLSGRFGVKEKAVVSTLIADKTYAGLKWKKQSKAPGQIFSRISYESSERQFKISEFDIFENRQDKAGPQSPGAQPSQRPAAREEETPIDHKKSYALNIALGRVKLTNEVLVERILAGTYDNENVIRQLILYYPTQEEFELLRKSGGEMGRAELLFKGVPDQSQLYLALLGLRFNFAFRNRNYPEIIRSLTGTFQRILDSTELPALFGALLVIGNVLNAHSFNGNAEAFTLDSLQAFSKDEIRSLLREKVSLPKLVHELTGANGGDFPRLISAEITVENLIQEIGEIRSLYGEFVEKKTAEEYKRMHEGFEDLLGVYKQTREYFGESDERFIDRLENFLRGLV